MQRKVNEKSRKKEMNKDLNLSFTRNDRVDDCVMNNTVDDSKAHPTHFEPNSEAKQICQKNDDR